MLTNKQLKQTGDIIYYLALASYSSSKYKISHQKEITQVISESWIKWLQTSYSIIIIH